MAISYQNEIPSARVNIRLSVQGKNEAEKIELPLKLLVLGKFRTQNQSMRIAEREKLLLHRDNFDSVMRSLDLELNYSVENLLEKDQEQLPISLLVQGQGDFSPDQIVNQVPALGRVLAARNLIRDLGSVLMDSRQMRKELETILKNQNQREELLKNLVQSVKFED